MTRYPIPENVIVRPLLETSEAFRNFYREQRHNIPRDLLWFHDPTLTGGRRGVARTKTDENFNIEAQAILLKRIPVRPEDACLVAHELAHFVVYGYGFPMLFAAQPHPLLGTVSSMLHDPLVFVLQKQYEFDLRTDFDNAAAGAKQYQQKFTIAPTAGLHRWGWILNRVKVSLTWQVIDPTQQPAYLLWFDEQFPDIADEATALLEIVKEIDFDTPERMTKLLQYLLATYNLPFHIRSLR